MLCAFKHVHIFKMYYKLLPIFKFNSLFIFRLLSFLKRKTEAFEMAMLSVGMHPLSIFEPDDQVS